MKKAITVWSICTLFLLVIGGNLMAQSNEKIIEPTDGFVNEIIKADVNADGSQAHTTYVFRRGGVYYLNSEINNVGYAITLKAENGTGRLPMLLNYPNATGSLGRILNAGDDAYVYNLFFDGMGPDVTTGDPDPLYTMNGQVVRAGAAGKVLVIDGSVILNCGQVLIRSNSGARKVQVTNSVLANPGQLSADNLGNGRIIDFRNGITDTVIFKNCTMVNTFDRIVRHYGAAANTTTAYIKYLEMDHNTIVHNTGAYGYIFLGDISDATKITNNLLYNPMTLGVDAADQQRFVEVNNIGEKDANGFPIFALIEDQPNTSYSPKHVMSNNAIVYDNTVENFMTTNSVQKAIAVTPRLAALVADPNPFVEIADLKLKKIPNVMIEVMNWYHALAIDTLGGGMITTASVDMDRRSRLFWTDSLDCSYTSSEKALEGSDGLPVGSTVWKSKLTDVASNTTQLPTEFSLSNNYPNPFNPSTKINFSMPVRANVSLKVFNVLGQEVARLAEKEFEAGTHSLDFNAKGLSSGLYIYTINIVGIDGRNFSASNKMTLLK